jgi:glycosyltransferase involved in cell wall biosynthesis
LVAEARASLADLDPAAGQPLVLATFPSVTTNPIQALLLATARERGVAPVAMRSLDQVEELIDLSRSGIATVLHLHWLDRVLRDADSEADAAVRARAMLDRLDALRAAGGHVVWTVHNELPRGARFEDQEARLAGEVARRADAIHVMAARTAELVAPRYALPADRILHVPHPNYDGVYPDHLSRLDARHALGLHRDDLVFLSLGAIQRYKGLAELLDAWTELGSARGRLLVAGIAADDPETSRAIGRAQADPTVAVRTRKLFSQEMQLYLRSADVAVLPYRGALNSGAMMLALTFGLPVVVPAGTGLADFVEPSFSIVYGGPAGPSLSQALAEAAALANDSARAAARGAVADLGPREISARFVTSLRARLGEPAVADRGRP